MKTWLLLFGLLSTVSFARAEEPLLVEVKAFDPDGFLSQVRLLPNGKPVSTNTAPPYKFSLADI